MPFATRDFFLNGKVPAIKVCALLKIANKKGKALVLLWLKRKLIPASR